MLDIHCFCCFLMINDMGLNPATAKLRKKAGIDSAGRKIFAARRHVATIMVAGHVIFRLMRL